MTKLIYVRLLDEGTSVYRPIPAQQISENTFAIGGEDLYDPQTETWEFLPGSLVLAENRIFSDGEYLIAVTQAKP